MNSVIIKEDDCRSIANGYHIDVWDMIKSDLELDNDATEVEITIYEAKVNSN